MCQFKSVLKTMQLELTQLSVSIGQAKDNTIAVFSSVIEAMLASSKVKYKAQMADLEPQIDRD